mgnify:CR=1 FL=1
MPHVSTAVHTRSKFLTTPCVMLRPRPAPCQRCMHRREQALERHPAQLARKVTTAAAAVHSVLGTAAAPTLLIVRRTRALLGAVIGHTPSALCRRQVFTACGP